MGGSNKDGDNRVTIVGAPRSSLTRNRAVPLGPQVKPESDRHNGRRMHWRRKYERQAAAFALAYARRNFKLLDRLQLFTFEARCELAPSTRDAAKRTQLFPIAEDALQLKAGARGRPQQPVGCSQQRLVVGFAIL